MQRICTGFILALLAATASADIDSRVLIRHAIEGNIAAAAEALEQGADLEVAGPDNGHGLYSYAITYGQTDFVQFLIEHGADVNHRDARGMTPAMFAVLAKNMDALRLLAAAGADLEARNFAPGFTAYMLADSTDYAEGMRVLEELGAEVCGGCRRHGDL